MSEQEISSKLKQFIFQFVDSVELIEALLFIRTHPDQWFSPKQISMELRSSPNSILKRLLKLTDIGFLTHDEDKDLFLYHPQTDDLKDISDELSNEYSIRRHIIFELVYSSSKGAKKFADAFILTKHKKTTGDS